MRCAAQNHAVSGSLERCMIVPAPQSRNSYNRARVLSNGARRSPQLGQTKPSGQRRLERNVGQLSSLARLHLLVGIGEASALKSLGRESKGRHYRGERSGPVRVMDSPPHERPLDSSSRASEPVSRDSVRAFHAGVHDPRDLARLRKVGFDGGRVLEPGCGTRRFFAFEPGGVAGKMGMTGVEMDRTTARIAKLLSPSAQIRHGDFSKAKLRLRSASLRNPPQIIPPSESGQPPKASAFCWQFNESEYNSHLSILVDCVALKSEIRSSPNQGQVCDPCGVG